MIFHTYIKLVSTTTCVWALKGSTAMISFSEGEKAKPYRLVKYFTFTSLVVVFIGALVLSLLFTHWMRRINNIKSEDYAKLLIANLNYQVFNNFSIPIALKFGEIQLHKKEQFDLMDNVVRNAVEGYQIKMVNIYNLSNVISYSFDSSQLGKKNVGGTAYQKAKMGETSSRFVQRGSFWEILLGTPKELNLVTMAPFRLEKTTLQFREGKGFVIAPLRAQDVAEEVESPIFGVFEVVQDLTEDYKQIFEFQKMMVLSITGVMGVLFLTLRLVVKRGEEILARRAQEQLELKERLGRAERLSALGELTAGVSHEIRNPLGIIRSSAELLNRKMAVYEPANPIAGIIVEEAGRLNTIITEFLNCAMPKTPNLLPTDVKEVVEKNLKFLDPQIRENHIIVTKHFEPSLPVVMADAGMLYQAFLNILMNAMQTMVNGGRIEVDAVSRSQSVVLSFRDSGKGIPPEVLNKVWDPFFTTKETGVGLGLGIVRNIIKSHGGEVNIANRPEGGAVVTLILPGSKGVQYGNDSDR